MPGLSCSAAWGIFPDQGSNPDQSVSPTLAGRFFTTETPGKPRSKDLNPESLFSKLHGKKKKISWSQLISPAMNWEPAPFWDRHWGPLGHGIFLTKRSQWFLQPACSGLNTREIVSGLMDPLAAEIFLSPAFCPLKPVGPGWLRRQGWRGQGGGWLRLELMFPSIFPYMVEGERVRITSPNPAPSPCFLPGKENKQVLELDMNSPSSFFPSLTQRSLWTLQNVSKHTHRTFSRHSPMWLCGRIHWYSVRGTQLGGSS